MDHLQGGFQLEEMAIHLAAEPTSRIIRIRHQCLKQARAPYKGFDFLSVFGHGFGGRPFEDKLIALPLFELVASTYPALYPVSQKARPGFRPFDSWHRSFHLLKLPRSQGRERQNWPTASFRKER